MKQHIIIADDDPGIQDIFQLIFDRAGVDVTIYPNGEQLINNDFEAPDAFILDKQLSGIDGLDVCRFLKRQERTKDIPVIMLSANPNIGKMAKEAGADDYLEKPFKLQDLLALMNKYLVKNKTSVQQVNSH
jgi:DNA-binding response OmpR family regulator